MQGFFSNMLEAGYFIERELGQLPESEYPMAFEGVNDAIRKSNVVNFDTFHMCNRNSH